MKVGERGLSLRVNLSDQPLYENISLQPHLGIHEHQYNVAFPGVALQYRRPQSAHKFNMKDTPEVLELLENVAYQRPSELRECSDFPVYDS